MDTSDDPDITAYHLKNRARSTENINAEEANEKPEKSGIYSWRNLFIRIVLACIFISLGIGLLIWSVVRSSSEPTDVVVLTTVTPPPQLNLARSEACYHGGTVRITAPVASSNRNINSMQLPSVWLHNHEKQQLKITLGNRSEAANGNWIADIYYLQYGAWVLMPEKDGKSPSEYKCNVDYSTNYTTIINEFFTIRFVAKNTSNSLDLYKGQLGVNDTDKAEIWTNDKELLYSMTISQFNKTFDYQYGENMADETPNFDDDIKDVIQRHCESTDLAKSIKDVLAKFMPV